MEEKPRKLIKETGNKVLIIGGSNKAIEVANALSKFADVTLFVDSTPETKLPEINLVFGEIKKISGRINAQYSSRIRFNLEMKMIILQKNGD